MQIKRVARVSPTDFVVYSRDTAESSCAATKGAPVQQDSLFFCPDSFLSPLPSRSVRGFDQFYLRRVSASWLENHLSFERLETRGAHRLDWSSETVLPTCWKKELPTASSRPRTTERREEEEKKLCQLKFQVSDFSSS